MTDRQLLELVLHKVTGIETDVAELKTNMSQVMQAVLETNDTVKRIEKKQDMHDRVIDLLSRRSIVHEALLKHAN